MPDDLLIQRAQERVGKTLRDKYHLDRVLGVGGMAVVYAATHRNKKKFAIKMLHPELSIQGDSKQRFLREGYVANTVEHPGAVAVLDDDTTEEGAAFIVMELLEGIAVDELWQKHGGRLPPRMVLGIADQLLAVLEAAHAKEIVHRDLKPANLFILRDGTLKVLDFGIARLREAVASGPSAATQTGALLGTPAFLPPEQAGGRTREIDGQTDVWAVGATMFTLMTGEFIHAAENATQMIIAAATKPARSIATAASCPPEVAALVDRALAFDKSGRWPSAAAMRAALQETYRMVFGGAPRREDLVELFSGASSIPKVEVDRTRALVQTPAAQPPPLVRAATMPAVAVSGFGGTTAQPVSSTPAPSGVPGLPAKQSNAPKLVAIGGGVVAAAIVLGVVIRSAHKSDAPTLATSADTPSATATVSSAPAIATSHAASTSEVMVGEAQLNVGTMAPSATGRQHVAAITNRQPPTTTPSATAPAAQSASALPAAPRAPVCELVEYTDANGITQLKKVCK